MWTWTALCADSKLAPAWLVGERTIDDARAFLTDLEQRLSRRVQLTTDGDRAYLTAGVADHVSSLREIAELVETEPSPVLLAGVCL